MGATPSSSCPDFSSSRFQTEGLAETHASFGPSGTVSFRPNRTALGLRDGAVAADAVTNETLAAAPCGNFSLWLNQHDYRLVAVG